MCARADAVLRQLAPQYIDTARARVVYRHFSFIGAESDAAANAAECAGDQNRFWDYADYLFTHQAGENGGAFAAANLKQFASQIGLERTPFDACVDGGTHMATVKQDTLEGKQRGVRATPTFFVNNQRIEGLPAANQLAQMIDSLQPK